MLTKKFTFSKKEKLKSKKEISRVFKDGIFFYSDSINVKIIKSSEIQQKVFKIGISVPKRLFKLAVNRNKIKRRIREAYRLNKQILYPEKKARFEIYNMFFIYKNKRIINYKDIEDDIIKLLKDVKGFIYLK